MKHLSILATGILTLTLVGCGGGGGGSSSSSGGGGSSSGISYTGSTSGAQLTETTAEAFFDAVFSSSSSSAGSVIGVETDSAPNGGKILRQINGFVESALESDVNTLTGVAVDETLSCTTSGSIRVTGDVNQTTGAFDTESDFSNCVEDGITYNGTMELTGTFDDFGDFEGSVFAVYDNVTISQSGTVGTIVGTAECRYGEYPQGGDTSQFVDVSIYEEAFWCLQNMLIENGADGSVYRYQNFEVVSILDLVSAQAYLLTAMKGRYYDPVLGYVDVSDGPNDILNESTFGLYEEYIDGSGEYVPLFISVLFTGANGSKAELVSDDFSVTYDLYLDTDGDGTFESPETFSWDQ